jgi:hypothetical protein
MKPNDTPAIEILVETLVTIPQASALLPPDETGRRPHIATIYRWMLRGVKGVRLETCLVGGKRFTSHEALQRFSEAVTRAAQGKAAVPRQSTRRKQHDEAVDRELQAAGL